MRESYRQLRWSLCLLALMGLSLFFLTPVRAEEELPGSAAPAEEAGPTPLTDFAPDEVRPYRSQGYDQGVTITKVSIDGNKLIDEGKIKEIMATRPGSLYSKKNLQRDLRRIYDMGYFTDKVKAVPISTNTGIHLRIEVEENAPVTGVNVEGNTLISDEDVQKIFADQTGLPQNIGQLNESIEKIEKLYADKGFILSRVTNIADDPDGTINLEIDEGKIAKVEFVGNRKTRDTVVERMMTVKAGQVYNEQLLTEDLKRVFALQSFSDVRRVITASPDEPGKYDLTIELDEKKTGAISLGGGFDTSTGIFGSVGYNDPNFLGRGQNFSSVAAVGTGVMWQGDGIARSRTYQFEMNWSNPSVMDTDNALASGIYGRDMASFNVPLGIERRIGGEVTWSRPIKSFKNMSMSLGLGGERVSLREGTSNDTLDDFGITDAQREAMLEGGTFLTASPTLAYDTRNNRFNPTSGWMNTASLTGAYGMNSNSYATVSTNLRKYIKIRDGITLALNAQGGTAGFGDIPEFNMFRMGGSYSVRGFQEGGLGVGNGFLMGTAELRTKIPLFGKLKNLPMADTLMGALFVDAGSLFGEADSNSLFDRAGMGASIGAGIRLNIPGIGPLRIDYAIPIAGGNSDYIRRFNFGVGHKF